MSKKDTSKKMPIRIITRKKIDVEPNKKSKLQPIKNTL